MKLKITLLIVITTSIGLTACVDKAHTSSPITINYASNVTCASVSLLTWSSTGTFQCADTSNGAVVTVHCPIGYAFPSGVTASLNAPAGFKYDNNGTVDNNIIGFEFIVGDTVSDILTENSVSSINAGAFKDAAIQVGSGSAVDNYVYCVASSNYSDWTASAQA